MCNHQNYGSVLYDKPTNNVTKIWYSLEVAEYVMFSSDSGSCRERGTVLFSDGNFAKNSITGEQKRSLSADIKSLEYQAWDLWQRMQELTTKCESEHVYAHAGILPNGLADQLADGGRREMSLHDLGRIILLSVVHRHVC